MPEQLLDDESAQNQDEFDLSKELESIGKRIDSIVRNIEDAKVSMGIDSRQADD